MREKKGCEEVSGKKQVPREESVGGCRGSKTGRVQGKCVNRARLRKTTFYATNVKPRGHIDERGNTRGGKGKTSWSNHRRTPNAWSKDA